ncbi:MAG: M67 family metallopeptidase [Lachnospiraceae bacterium]|nr:M67 family metallopeptidase [Lachnospiraceae bacterium]
MAGWVNESTPLRIPDEVKQRIKRHAEQVYPAESCGLLLGKSGDHAGSLIREYFELENECPVPDHTGHYEIDPLKLYEYESKFREKGLEIVGFAHSHPDAPAYPSQEDYADMLPGMIYLITGVSGGNAKVIQAWVKENTY